MNRVWRNGNSNLNIVLATLFVVCLALQTWTGWIGFKATQQTHGEPGNILGPTGYVWRWGEVTFQNWQSEFLQLLVVVVLTGYLVQRRSAESMDGDEALRQTLARLESRLEDLQRRMPDSGLTPPDPAPAHRVPAAESGSGVEGNNRGA